MARGWWTCYSGWTDNGKVREWQESRVTFLFWLEQLGAWWCYLLKWERGSLVLLGVLPRG